MIDTDQKTSLAGRREETTRNRGAGEVLNSVYVEPVHSRVLSVLVKDLNGPPTWRTQNHVSCYAGIVRMQGTVFQSCSAAVGKGYDSAQAGIEVTTPENY